MNTYRYVFASKCPSDDETIIYGLEVRSKEMIRVEAIKDACAEWPTGFQEAIAADLRDVLGAAISLRAQHQGIEVLTELDAPSAPGMASVDAAEDARKYRELLYAVGNKYPGESRHETALRYIRRAEEPTGEKAAAARQESK